MRDPASLNKPSTREIGAANMIGSIPGTDVHWGLVFGIVAAVASYILIYHTVFGFAARVAGGNIRAAKIVGLGVGKLILTICFLAGASAGLAGMVEVAAVEGRTNANLAAGYGFTGILVAFLARQNPLAIIPVAILLGGISASGGLLQRRLGLPDASVQVLQGIIFVVRAGQRRAVRADRLPERQILTWRTERSDSGRCRSRCSAARSASPRRFCSSASANASPSARGRINLGLEGTLVMGAMSAYGISYLTGSPWLGVLAAGLTGALLGALHAGICSLPRVNDIAVGIALMLFGTGLAFYLGKPLIEPTAPRLPAIDFGWWSDIAQVRAALRINVLFLIGVALAPILYWAFRTTRWGLLIRTAGESSDAARAMGYSVLGDPPARHHGRRLPRRHRRLVPVAVLSRQLERGPLQRPGHHGGGAGDLRALGPDAVPVGVAGLWRRGGARAGAAIGRRHLRLSSVQRRALHPDAGDHDHHLLAETHADRRAGRTFDHTIEPQDRRPWPSAI